MQKIFFFPPCCLYSLSCLKMSVLFENFTKESGAGAITGLTQVGGGDNSQTEYPSNLEEKGQILYYCVALWVVCRQQQIYSC